jgi:hypothetical protein
MNNLLLVVLVQSLLFVKSLLERENQYLVALDSFGRPRYGAGILP